MKTKHNILKALFFLLPMTVGASYLDAGLTAVASVAARPCPDTVAAWCQQHGPVTPVIIELVAEPTKMRAIRSGSNGESATPESLRNYTLALVAAQNSFLASLGQRGVRARMCVTDVPQSDGSTREVQQRFTYTTNGIVAWVVDEDLDRLQALPEVRQVKLPPPS